MKKVIGIISTISASAPVPFVSAELQWSTASDLPALHDQFDGVVICEGTIAQIIQSGQFATLDDDGKWYADGSEVSTEQEQEEESEPNSAQLTLGKTVKPAVIQPESFEPDELETEQTETEQTEEPQEVTEDAELL